ncbi:hypothetical protein ABT160_16485 [Streptomyces sp. NPDC001941]|uniref:STAS domain-containing protein n=1 Tax=Streptomyces sp. NPDC001941 TaxID=3154659 RepID=UPI003329790E
MSKNSTSPILSAPAAPPKNDGIRWVTTRGTILALGLEGAITRATAGPLRALVAAAADHGYKTLIVDLSAVTAEDGALNRIIEFWRRRGRIRLTGRPEVVCG